MTPRARLALLFALGAALAVVLWSRVAVAPPAPGPPLTGDAAASPGPAPAASDRVVLVSDARRAWDAELLQTYGVPGVSTVESGATADAVWREEQRVVVSNEMLPEAARERLRRHVRDGGWLVELGPLPGVCGPEAGWLPATSHRLSGPGLDGVRLAGPLAHVEGCDDAASCGAEVWNWAEADGEAARLPLVLVRREANAGGCVRILTDLSAALVRMRQGNPARADARAEGARLSKPADLFVGELEPDDVELPRADRLGYRLMALIASAPGPDALIDTLPATTRRGLVIYTADQDYVPGPGLLAQSAEAGGAGLTFLLTAADIGSPPDVIYPKGEPGYLEPEVAAELTRRGHGLGIHPSFVELDPTRHAEVIAKSARAFEARFGAAPRVIRNHHLIWAGHLQMARQQAAAGLRMSLDYVSNPRDAGFRPGFMTGSGLAMRFADADFALIPIYQQATQMDDLALASASASERDAVVAALVARTAQLLDTAAREHVALTVLHHPAWWYETGNAWQRAILQGADARGMAVWGAERWLAFLEQRARARIRGVDGAGLRVELPDAGLALWLEGLPADAPLPAGAKDLGEAPIGGTRMRRLSLPPGPHNLSGGQAPPF